jgi:hypothetical protein
MAHNARDNRSPKREWISRRSWLLAGLAIPLSRVRASETLDVSFDGDNLRIATPGLHFLAGKPLERLKNAETVAFVAQISLYSDAFKTPFRFPVRERLIVSYDLWEEKFAVKIPGLLVKPKAHLTASQAENFCIDNLAYSTLGLPPDRPFWMKFELRTTSQKDLSSLMGDGKIYLSRLVELFDRRPEKGELQWTLTAGPLRLPFLPRTTAARGNRIG